VAPLKKGEKTKERVYQFLRAYIEQYGYGPSVREVCQGTDLKSPSSAFLYLQQLGEEGRILFDQGKKRSISLPDRQGNSAVRVPILGSVRAGMPTLAVEEDLGFLTVDAGFSRGRELFALRVKGDSMIGAAILEGDLVVVERRPDARDGEIVAALLEEEATVKRFFQEKDGFRLQPENDDYPPIYTKELVILGKVIAVIRDRL
jgi:repressor LexA